LKILICAVGLEEQGGVANFYRALRPHLGDDVEFFTVGGRAGERGVTQVMRRVVADWARFRRHLSAGRYDLVHVNPSLAVKASVRDGVFLFLADQAGTKTLVSFHGWDLGFEKKVVRPMKELFKAAYFRADAMVVLASKFKGALEELGYTGIVKVDTTPVDDEVFSIPEEALRRPAGDGVHREVTVLFLSRLEEVKGILIGLEAFAMVRRKLPLTKLVVAGDGEARDKARRKAEELGLDGVEFLGFVRGKEKEWAFRRADLFLLPTYHAEGMPISLLEAMSYGLPAITRPMGGVADFFEDERMGFLTDSLDPAVFADFVARLAADPGRRQAIGNFNRRYARERFAASKVAARLRGTYRALLAPTGGV
jgi:glycosyltransferase involved in cell wall biosynthesis